MTYKPEPGMRPLICRVCGHVEWVAAGESLPEGYACSLCGARAKAMLELDDAYIARQQIEVEVICDGLWCLRKKPRYNREWEHVSYAVQTGAGLVLFDPPPIFNAAAVKTLTEIGIPDALLLSHSDFVGPAQLWRNEFRLSVAMGDDRPLPGARVTVDKPLLAPTGIDDNWQVYPLPGHTVGSIAMSGTVACGQRVLLAGDIFAVWDYPDSRTQVCIFEEPGGGSERVRRELDNPPDILCCCTGWLSEPGPALRALGTANEACARPYLSEQGGVWGSRDEDRWLALLR